MQAPNASLPFVGLAGGFEGFVLLELVGRLGNLVVLYEDILGVVEGAFSPVVGFKGCVSLKREALVGRRGNFVVALLDKDGRGMSLADGNGKALAGFALETSVSRTCI